VLVDPYWHCTTEEYEALLSNSMWDFVPWPPVARTAKWIFKYRFMEDGSLNWYKAHWVLWGFTQLRGVDYDETFSP
jgi:hypothetical protein